MKFIEIRDVATYIPVVAFRPSEVARLGRFEFALSEPSRCRVIEYGLERCGWPTAEVVEPGKTVAAIVVRLDNGEGRMAPYDWPGGSRTMRAAHEAIVAKFENLRSGDVVDVEFELGQRPEPRKSEALPSTVYRYATKYRPPDFATVPSGWRLVERGTEKFFEKRTDLPIGERRFGIIEYDTRLSDRDVAAFQLEYLGEATRDPAW